MATLVRFFKYDKMFANEPDKVFAYFPQKIWDKNQYGIDIKTSYDQDSKFIACHKDNINGARPSSESEYLPLKRDLESIGYTLKIVK